ncbi:MAG: hypothetical protein IH994_12550 [Proteobacteria bacterium]|nr:hypothetical protein [Pseudomonadota bacterium]
MCAVFLAAAFLFAGPSPAEAAKDADLKGSTLELFKAVALNDMTGVKKSIEDGADLYAENEEGMTAADLAVDKGHFIVAHYLLSRRLAGQTPPVALVPGRAKEAQKAAKSRPKRKFAAPPPKPPAPPSMVGALPGAKPKKIPGETPDMPPPDIGETIAEVPPEEADDKPAEKAPEARDAPDAQDAPDAARTVAEAPEPPGEPLAGEGPLSFFKSLVDLITPGGVRPPPKPGDAAKEADSAPGAAPGAELEETIVEEAVEEPDEIIVDVTGDVTVDVTGDLPGDIVVEITDEPAAKLEETDLETVTIDLDLEDQAKPEKPEESFLDRMAGLFTSDDKKEKPEDKGPPTGAPAVGEIETYELPLPPPRISAPNKFSPRFLDKLADFLESGDEEAFKAWLPEMQVINPGALRAPGALDAQQSPAEPAEVAARPEDAELESAEPPVPDKAPMAAVEKAPLEPPPEAPPGVPPGALAGEGEKPLTAETDKPGMIKGVFNKLVGILTPGFGDKDRSGRLLLEADEKLAQAGEKDAPDGEEADADRPPKYWPITEVTSAEAPPLAVRKPARGSLLRISLTGVTLSLGESVSLENSFPPSGTGIDPYNRCVKKNRGTTLFCLETVDWPEAMQPDFLVPTILYTGQKAIARYDQGIASRFHALFPSESFQRIAGYFHQRFGKPTDAWNRSIAPFAKPRQDNPTLAWRSIDPETQVITVLEIRKYDDSRGGFPDTKRGAVMLYLANAPPIFPQVSSHELMRLSRGTMGPLPAPGSSGEAPGDAPGTEAEPGVKKPLSQMTSEEIQAERRKRKAKEAAEQGGPVEGVLEGIPGEPDKPGEDSFELPPDPLNR